MSASYLVPVVPATINGQSVTVPKYYNTDLSAVTYAAIPYGNEPLAIVTVAVANAALAAESDVYAFPKDVTQKLAPSDVARLGAYLTAAKVPSDQIQPGMAFADALSAIAKIFLVAQFVVGSTGQTGSLFTNGVTLNSSPATSPSISAALTAAGVSATPDPNPAPNPDPALTDPLSNGVGNLGADAGATAGAAGAAGSAGSAGSAAGGNSNGSGPGPFDLTKISNLATVGAFLDGASQTWAGGQIVFGGF